MYEHRKQPLLSRAEFCKRVASTLDWRAFGVLALWTWRAVSWVTITFARLNWIDSLLNASMILGGMGPVDPLPTNTRENLRFAVTLCFQGWLLSASYRCCLAPFVHRLLHRFHAEEREQ